MMALPLQRLYSLINSRWWHVSGSIGIRLLPDRFVRSITLSILVTCGPSLQGAALEKLPSIGIPSNLLMLITQPNPESVRIANLVYDNRFVFDGGLEEIKFPTGKIDWDFPWGSSRNTYHLWMHSLNTVSYLCNANETTGDKKHLLHALGIIQDWVTYAASGTNKFVWYDHSTANRTITLTYFYQLASSAGVLSETEKQQIIELLLRHAHFLAEPKNYSQYNHGLMMDRALLLSGLFLSETYPQEAAKWVELASRRIGEALDRDFTPSMVHIENSPAYHLYVTGHFRQISRLLAHFNVAPPAQLAERLERADEFSRCVTKPNNFVPMVGDTGLMQSPFISSLKSQAFADAGIVIMCQPAAKPAESTWLMFKSGYYTHVHKHADDLSFTLYALGKDIFIDGGVLNYDPKNRFATHLNEAAAHNTLIVDGRTYPLQRRAIGAGAPRAWTMFKQAGVITNRIASNCDFVRGYNSAYPGVSLERTIVYVKPDIFVIYDLANGAERHDYTQVFRVGNEMRLEKLDKTGMQLSDVQSESKAFLLQVLGNPLEVQLYHGDSVAVRGYGARKFDVLDPVVQVEFSQTGTRCEYLTLIGIGRQGAEMRKLAGTMLELSPTQITIRLQNGEIVELDRHLLHAAEASQQREAAEPGR